MGFLYKELDTASKFGVIKKEIPDFITNNLSPIFEARPYQIEAFSRFIYYFEKGYDGMQI